MLKYEVTTLSEAKSKQLLTNFGVPFTSEQQVITVEQACQAATEIGFPVVVKLCSDSITHKTERGLLKLNLNSVDEVAQSAKELMRLVTSKDGEVTLLVAKMEYGRREFIAGVVTDPQFGRFVMIGLGGIFAELIEDVAYAPIPINYVTAHWLIDRLRNQKFFDEFRGEMAVRRDELAKILVALSDAAVSDDSIDTIDVNPLIVRQNGSVVGVDALVGLNRNRESGNDFQESFSGEHFKALFQPRGVVVVGASSHPGKFGFVSLHNILACKFSGPIFATNLEQVEILGVQTVASIDELPDGIVDLAFVCTPAHTNSEIIRACARKKIKAIYLTSAGYSESGSDGAAAEETLRFLAKELDVLVVGPNGQGFVSTPANLCAQIVAPYPPSGSISVVSQSGNLVSSFLNYARTSDVGIARAVSVGNAAVIGVPEVLEYLAKDAQTKVGLAYLEGIQDGPRLLQSILSITALKPLVVVKGGATKSGALAATSHTGALATDDRIFDAVCKASGAIRLTNIEAAFDVAATFATQPLPKGPRTVVITTAGGWGVITADALAVEGVLQIIDLPPDLSEAVGKLLPARWSKNNPIDCAGGETRDTLPEIMRIAALHPDVDALIFLGIGIQSNQARMMREGNFYPEYDLERIVAYHERQDQRYAQCAFDLSIASDKPILVATELAVADSTNSGVTAVQNSGRLCYANGQRAAFALSQTYRYAKWLGFAR